MILPAPVTALLSCPSLHTPPCLSNKQVQPPQPAFRRDAVYRQRRAGDHSRLHRRHVRAGRQDLPARGHGGDPPQGQGQKTGGWSAPAWEPGHGVGCTLESISGRDVWSMHNNMSNVPSVPRHVFLGVGVVVQKSKSTV